MAESYPAFASHPKLNAHFKTALASMGFDRMTEIQAKTFDAASLGKDVLGRARTGSGKTVAFLLPALERLLQDNNNNSNKKSTRMLVLSPTRELAQQIAEQTRLLTAHMPNMSHQVMVGGTPKPKDVSAMKRKVPTIIIATPGRLQDHLESTVVHNTPFKDLFRELDVLVLDETDRLLDMGFRREIDKIIKYLPRNKQTLLFSATIPEDVKHVIRQTMRDPYITVDCIHDDQAESSSHTNAQVSQAHVILPTNTRMASGTVDIIRNILEKQPHSKIVAFFPTANLVAFYASLLRDVLEIPRILEIHSRKSQSQREKASESFRKTNHGCLLTSDVSARGVDYPDVTHVLQFGVADSRESYIHRLGRTGRAGKLGQGILVLTDVERGFLRHLKGLDIPVHPELQAVVDGPTVESQQDLAPVWASIGSGRNADLALKATKAYVSALGFYNTHLKARCGVKGTDALVAFCNAFAYQVGFTTLPPIEKKTIGKMGLKGIQGLNVGSPLTIGGGGGRPRNAGPPMNRNRSGANANNGLAPREEANGRGRPDARNGGPRNAGGRGGPRASGGGWDGTDRKRAIPLRDDPHRPKRPSRGDAALRDPNSTF